MAAASAEPRVDVVVDDVALRAALQFSLELDGFVVDCQDSHGALSRGVGPDRGCLVLDYDLAKSNGLQVLETLRSRGVGTPALLVATHPNRTLRQRAAAAGARIIEKPLLSDALAQALRQMLNDRTNA